MQYSMSFTKLNGSWEKLTFTTRNGPLFLVAQPGHSELPSTFPWMSVVAFGET